MGEATDVFTDLFRRGSKQMAGCLAFLLICLFFLAQQASALDPNKRISQYIHTSWRVQDGSGEPAYGIAQTSDGFLWFNSGDLRIFDGVRFTSWDGPPNGGSITKGAPFGQIMQAVGDRTGGLWVFGVRGIVHLKGRVVTSQFQLDGLRNLQNVAQEDDGSIWVVRGNNSVSDRPLCHVTDREVKCFGKADGIPISPLNSLLADGTGGFWLGGQTALVHWQNGASQTYPIEALKDNVGQPGVVSMARGSDGSLWIGLLAPGPGRGLGRFVDGAFKTFVTSSFDGSKLAVHSMTLDRDGNLWVATHGMGIFRIHGQTVDHYGRTDGMSSDTVNDVFADREGILWAATTQGIDKFRDPEVASFTSAEGLGNESPSGVLARKDGTIWVANLGSLDHIEKNGAVSSIRSNDGLPGNRVTSMLEDRTGNMWVGVDDELYLFKSGKFRRLAGRDGGALGLVAAMAEDVEGNIWAECLSKPPKLVRIRDFQVREEYPSSQVPTGRSLAPDPRGGLWIGTLNGDLALFRHGIVGIQPLNIKGDPVSHQIVANLDGSVLAGSADGLVGLRQGKVQVMSTKNGLPCNFITSFVQDQKKRWWLYTDCGIVELLDSELQRWWSNPEVKVQTRVYDELDGARAGRPTFNSVARSADGRVWFAQGNVVQMLDPSRLTQKALPAATYIRSLLVDRKEFSVSENLELSPHPRDLEIDYTSPTFLVSRRVKFRYRLDPYDKDWHDADARRQAFYNDLPPGKYTFHVVAANGDGVWNGTPSTLKFSVAPSYYQTIWFRTLCALVLFGLLWAAHRKRVGYLHRQFQMTLDARVAERTRIARELHDTLLQSAHGVLLRFQTVSRLLPGRAAEAKEKLDSAIEQTARFITEARDEVQNLRDSTVEGNNLALAISALAQDLATASTNQPAPEVQVTVEGAAQDLRPIIRDEIYKITAEALRNVFLHAAAGRVEVELRYGKDEFRLRVRDDGKGIDPKILANHGREGHYGLNGMEERAAVIGGKLTVWSEVDAGTELELRVPVSAYATARKRFSLFRKMAATA